MDVQEFFRWDEFWQFQDINLWRLIMAFTLAAGSSWIIAELYRRSYRGSGYTQSLTHTLILMSCIVSLIMIVIGSNIARAFSLVGALSIIRFRTAVKNTRDTAFIFLAITLGMAAGSRFYATAVVATILFAILILILDKSNYGGTQTPAQVLRLCFPPHVDPEKAILGIFSQFLKSWNLLSQESIQLGSQNEVTYQVQLKENLSSHEFLEKLKTINENHKVSLFCVDREVSL